MDRNRAVALQLNQLANSAVIKLSKSLNTGMAEEMIHARIHRARAMPTHELIATQSRLWMRSVPLKMRV
jgi:hypothetical protein